MSAEEGLEVAVMGEIESVFEESVEEKEPAICNSRSGKIGRG